MLEEMLHKPFPVPRAQAWMRHMEQLQGEPQQPRPLSPRGTRSHLLGDPSSYRDHNRVHPRQATELKPALAGGRGEPSISHQPRSIVHPPHLAFSSTVCWGSRPGCRPPCSTEPLAQGSDAQAPHQEVSGQKGISPGEL